jgi:Ca-activated chloride channel family protein
MVTLISFILLVSMGFSSYMLGIAFAKKYQAQQAYKKDDITTARQLWTNTVVDKKAPDALYNLGVAAFKQKDYRLAQQCFDAVRADTSLAPVHREQAAYNLVNALASLEQYKEALTVCEDILEKNPGALNTQEKKKILLQLLEQEKSEQSNQSSQQQQPQEGNGQRDQQEQEKTHHDEGDQRKSQSQNNTQQSQQDADKDRTNSQSQGSQEKKDQTNQHHEDSPKRENSSPATQQQNSLATSQDTEKKSAQQAQEPSQANNATLLTQHDQALVAALEAQEQLYQKQLMRQKIDSMKQGSNNAQKRW